MGFVSLGLRQRVIRLAGRNQTDRNRTSQTVIRGGDDSYLNLGLGVSPSRII